MWCNILLFKPIGFCGKAIKYYYLTCCKQLSFKYIVYIRSKWWANAHQAIALPPELNFVLVQYDYMERLDGKEKWSVVESPRERRSIQTVVLNEAVFVQYLDAGAWHLAFYNDGRERETVSFSTNVMGERRSQFFTVVWWVQPVTAVLKLKCDSNLEFSG